MFTKVKFLYTTAAVVGLVSSTIGCSYDLENGIYQAKLEGTASFLDGGSETIERAVSVSVALVKPRGAHGYEFQFCEGMTDYLSTEPCFDDVEVLDSLEGLTGYEETWFQQYGDDGACDGVESISVRGEITSPNTADIEIGYLVNFDEADEANCLDVLTDQPFRMTLTGQLAR